MSETKDILDLVEEQGRAWEEFKKANDEKLKAIEEKNYAPADLEEKVEGVHSIPCVSHARPHARWTVMDPGTLHHERAAILQNLHLGIRDEGLHKEAVR